MLMSGFVERIGDSVALVSSDGSAHDPDLLMVEALDAMVVAAGANAGSSEISIAVPAYWKPGPVQALRNGLRTHVGFVRSGMAPRLVSDAVAAVTAVNSELSLPDEGVVGLLDFGGAGTSATLVQLGSDFEPVTTTMRCADFSGSEIDHALLLRVFEELGPGGDLDSASTEAAGQIGLLREQCRAAKERLSTESATELVIELGPRSRTIDVTRHELEDLIQDRLTGLIFAFDEMLVRCQKTWADLAAVVAVGGVASIPLVTQRLSTHTRLPVLTPSQPALAAATGALLLASRGDALDLRTRTSVGLLTAGAGTSVIELPAGDVMVIDADALTDRELAWSQTEFPEMPTHFDGGGGGGGGGGPYDDDLPAGWTMRLNMNDRPRARPWRRLRLSQLVIGTCALVAMTAIGGVAYTLTGIENRQAPVVPSVAPLPAPPPSSVAPSPVPPPPTAAPVPSSAPPSPPPPPPPPVEVTTTMPPVATTTTTVPTTHPTTTHRPTTTTTTPTPTTTTTTQLPTTTPTTTSQLPTTTPTTTTVPMTTEWLRIPLLPVPIPVQVPQNQVPAPQTQMPMQQMPGGGYPQMPGGGYPQMPGGAYPQMPGGGYSQNPFLGPGE